MLLRNEPNPGREVTSRPEGPGVSNTRDQSGRQHRTDPGNVMKALARLAGPVPGHDHPIELQDLLLEAEQLSAERGKARTGNLRHPFVARVGNNMQQFRDTFTPTSAIMPNSARCARIELITAVCWRMNRWRVR